VKTACFFEYTGPGRVSIARRAPRDHPAGYRVFKTLAPGAWFNNVSKDEYERRYGEQLAALDARATWEKLHELTEGIEPVLLCWERGQLCACGRQYCHRHMAARWFERELGVTVLEVDFKVAGPGLF
jgi:hypothetical protein